MTRKAFSRALALIMSGLLVESAIPAAAFATGTASASPFGASDAIEPAELAEVTGQADLNQTVQAQNRSTVSGNTVSGNSNTGTIAFDAASFQNMNGLSVLSANTGNNVAINASLNVNVAVHP